jgi:hypothetical protein
LFFNPPPRKTSVSLWEMAVCAPLLKRGLFFDLDSFLCGTFYHFAGGWIRSNI